MKTRIPKSNCFIIKRLPASAVLAVTLGGLFSPAAADAPLKLGANNAGTQPDSIAAGGSNDLGSSTTGASIAVGNFNSVHSTYGAALFGAINHAYGMYTLTSGYSNSTSGYASTSLGNWNVVASTASQGLAAGNLNVVEGQNSMALGDSLTARSKSSVVVGSWNAAVSGETYFQLESGVNKEFTYSAAKTSWRGTDSLFVVGNGTATNARSNALVVTKNGAVTIPSGPLTVGGYPVLTTGLTAFALGGGATGNGGLLAIGEGSIANAGSAMALGYYAEATGGAAISAGDHTKAGGLGAVALGSYTQAKNEGGFAGGRWNTAEKNCATVFGYSSLAGGSVSVAMGYGANAIGEYSVCLGQYSDALGQSSMAGGLDAYANGVASVALGNNAASFSDNSTALGCGTWAWKNGQTVVGRYNLIPTNYPRDPLPDGFMMPRNDTTLDEADEVLVVGGGSGAASAQRKNAMVVQASGDTSITGTLKVGNATMSSTASGSPVFTQPVILQDSAIVNDIPMYGEN